MKENGINKIIRIIAIIMVSSVIMYFALPIIKNMYKNPVGGSDSATAEVYSSIPEYKKNPYWGTYDVTDKIKKQEEKMAQEPSDIEGWSNLDKHKAGLLTYDGSDTDGDGLTDKEEIEVYNTDPKAKSTSGDMYSDKYKVEHDMDLTKQYDLNYTPEFKHNKCPEVTLTATRLEDLTAYVTKKPIDYYRGINSKLYAAYEINFYDGDVSIDLTDALRENGLTINDIEVITCDVFDDFTQVTKPDCKRDGNVISFKLDSSDSLVGIIKKESISGKVKNALSSVADKLLKREDDNTQAQADALVWDFFISPPLGWKPAMYYVSSGDEATDKAMMDAVIAEAEEMTDAATIRYPGQITKFMYHPDYFFTYDDFKEVSKEKMAFLRSKFELLPGGSHYIVDGRNAGAAINYFNLADVANVSTETIKDGIHIEDGMIVVSRKNNFSSGFSRDDALLFDNFATSYTTGVCAGFAYLTSQVYNNGGVNPTGDYNIEGYGDVSWDLGKAPENYTFMDPKLNDYGTPMFSYDHTDENGIMSKDLTEAEEQVVNMLGGYWGYYNDNTDDIYGYNNENQKLSYSMIEETKRILDQGKILNVDLLGAPVKDENGNEYKYAHAINIIGYDTYNPGEEERTVLYVYDCNTPSDIGWASIVVDRHGDWFNYYYEPNKSMNDPSFYSSYAKKQDEYGLNIFDENLNPIPVTFVEVSDEEIKQYG